VYQCQDVQNGLKLHAALCIVCPNYLPLGRFLFPMYFCLIINFRSVMNIELKRVAELMNQVCGASLKPEEYQDYYMVDNGTEWVIVKK